MSDIEPDEARDVADEILSRPEFRERTQSLVDRAFDWFLERLGDILAFVVGGERGRVLGYIVVIVAIVAALWFIWRVLPRRRLSRPELQTSLEVETDERPSRADWLALAAEAEAQGQWDRGVHARYHALTEGLAGVEELSPEPSVTSGEHRNTYTGRHGPDSSRSARFAETTDRYERIWFGPDRAEASDPTQVAAADDELLGGRA